MERKLLHCKNGRTVEVGVVNGRERKWGFDKYINLFLQTFGVPLVIKNAVSSGEDKTTGP